MRGHGDNKSEWGIKMNDARSVYLGTYFKIDLMDHLIKNCRIFYQSWKYWNSQMLESKDLMIVVAYDIYNECAEGGLKIEWKIEHPIEFCTFRDMLSKQMLK